MFALETVPAREDGVSTDVAQYAGFSLHAGLGVEAEQRDKLERLVRYVSRPPVAVERLGLTLLANSQALAYALPNAYFDSLALPRLVATDRLNPPNRRMRTRMFGGVAGARG